MDRRSLAPRCPRLQSSIVNSSRITTDATNTRSHIATCAAADLRGRWMMGEEDGPPPSFTQLLDRGIAAEGALASWCPTMDLLALATADGQLHVHRLNWQRLWWSSPDAPITGARGCVWPYGTTPDRSLR
jgi:hypothetical protein